MAITTALLIILSALSVPFVIGWRRAARSLSRGRRPAGAVAGSACHRIRDERPRHPGHRLVRMDPRAAFPIMMGSGAMMAMAGGLRFMQAGRFDGRDAALESPGCVFS
jgi:hypothetical protein